MHLDYYILNTVLSYILLYFLPSSFIANTKQVPSAHRAVHRGAGGGQGGACGKQCVEQVDVETLKENIS